MIYSGIDLHKSNMVITAIDSNGQQLAQRKLGCQKPMISGVSHHRTSTSATAAWSPERPIPVARPATGTANRGIGI